MLNYAECNPSNNWGKRTIRFSIFTGMILSLVPGTVGSSDNMTTKRGPNLDDAGEKPMILPEAI